MVHAVIGVYAFEQAITQPLSINLSFSVDAARASQKDLLSDTQDYAAICNAVVFFVQKTPCRLLETLAQRLLEHLKEEFQLTDIQLSVTKKPKDLPFVDGITITVCSQQKMAQ